MEDSEGLEEPVGSGKVYARAQGEELSPSAPSPNIFLYLNTIVTALLEALVLLNWQYRTD
jgi:hypothetical protein